MPMSHTPNVRIHKLDPWLWPFFVSITAVLNHQLNAARVPKPTLRSLVPLPDQRDFEEYCRRKARKWAEEADTFILPVNIEDLQARPKNTEELKLLASKDILAMESEPEDARSATFKDINGITLACVPAWRDPGCPKLQDADYSGAHGRTLAEVMTSNPSHEDHYDGLNVGIPLNSFTHTHFFAITRTVEATQTLHSILHPITPERDVRHTEEGKYMVYLPDGGI
ncbi:hypothetical protein B0H13DRAFT_1855134 [Mycena leptocephala]|nr:hypothetical protein B0H13DRAFT_1855134 [Mycena leptocephala]